MKKILTLGLSCLLILGLLAACGNETDQQDQEPAPPTSGSEQNDQQNNEQNDTQNDQDQDTDTDTGSSNNNSSNNNSSNNNSSNNSSNNNSSSNNSSSNNSSSNNSSSNTSAVSGKSLSQIIDLIYAKQPIDLNVATTNQDLSNADMLKYNTGLSSNAHLKGVAVSEPIIGSIPYSLVLARVDDAANSKSIAEAMASGINQRKWVCVEANNLKVVGYNDLVLLIMVSDEYSDTVTVNQITDAFKSVCGGKLSFEVK